MRPRPPPPSCRTGAVQLDEQLGPLAAAADRSAADLDDRRAIERLRARDHTLWQPAPTEVADRLGWLDCPASMRSELARLDALASACRADGLERVVVLGMGGSSLFPEVLARTFGSRPDRMQLSILDTTDPAAVARVASDWPLARTVFVVSSKSGSTIETRSHLEHFWAAHPDPGGFVAVTDPGSELGDLARARGFRAVFENPPDIGGRYSALSLFGLVPAALAGVDIAALLDGGALGLNRLSLAARLAAVLAGGVAEGRDKLTFVLDHRIASFGLWVEQLIAESTGKLGTGVVPVVGEPLGSPDVYGTDRLFVTVGDVTDLERDLLHALTAAGHPVVGVPLDPQDLTAALGTQVVCWEAATALCGAALGINPFDQPDVAAAKAATQRVLDAGAIPHMPTEAPADLFDRVSGGDYVALHAYVDPGSEAVDDLERIRTAIRDRLGVATTLGLGPRFLHSTGQLHKGGPPSGVFVQVVSADDADAVIPGAPYGFTTLKQAQAAGDLATLHERGLRAGRVTLDNLCSWEAST